MSTTSAAAMDAKSAKKRKAKVERSTTPLSTNGAHDTAANGSEGNEDSPYLRELTKQIRNAHKKLAGLSKTEAIIKEFPKSSLDDLVAQKKINADQKAQILKKPQLQAQLDQFEEQKKSYLQFAQESEARFAKEKETLNEAHASEIEQIKQEALLEAKKGQDAKVRNALQVVSQFLNTAAAKRQEGDSESPESRAYEGTLFQLYQGNSTALETMQKLVQGAEENTKDTSGEEVEFSFAQLKLTSMKDVPQEGDEGTESLEQNSVTNEMTTTDPTIANAGLTELEDTAAISVSMGPEDTAETNVTVSAPEQASITADAANAVAESSWDPQASVTAENTETGEGWVQVQVPRDPSETETGVAATPAAQQSTSNWADEAGAAAEEKAAPPPAENDGFSEVRRDRGRGRGGHRDGRGSDGRGRGRGRGEFRGRGGGRGGRGGNRGHSQAAPSSGT